MSPRSGSGLVRLCLASSRTVDRATRLAYGILSGFWLGVLTRDQLHAVVKASYDEGGPQGFYGTDEYNRRGLWEWERNALEEHFAACRSVLVPAAGGGREVFALRRMGLEADGFECHPELVSAANDFLRREGMAPDIRLAPWDGCPEYEKGFDGVIVGWGAYMLIRGREKRVGFLRRLRERVDVGSPILVSFFTGRAGTLPLTARIGNRVARILGRDPVEVGDTMNPHYMHYFTREEIADELRDGGFEMKFFSREGYGHAVGAAV